MKENAQKPGDAPQHGGADAARSVVSIRDVFVGPEPGGGPADDILKGVSLELRPGELVAVLGANGAGKSTLVRTLTGLLVPRAGEVRLGGVPVAELSRARVAQRLGVVLQREALDVDFTVRELVAMGRAPHQGGWLVARPEDARLVDAVLARTGLVPLADRRVATLSGGEQKRVAVARALAQEPDALVLDEAGAFLDVRHQLELYELVLDEVTTRGLACLAVMHDLTVAAQFATRVVLLKGGRVLADGSVDEVMTWRRLGETFDTDLYCGVIETNGARFFLPMRGGGGGAGGGGAR